MRDVLVIGAGVVGSLTAFELTRRAPERSIELLEMSASTAGASSHAGAIDAPYSWSPLHAKLQAESWRWHETVGWDAPEVRYRRPLTMHWLGREHDEEPLGDVVRLDWRSGSLPAQYDASICVLTRAYVVDPLSLIETANIHATRAGVQITRGVRVTALAREGAHVRVACDDGIDRRCRHVVLAVGPWVRGLARAAFGSARSRGLRVKRVHGLRLKLERGSGAAGAWADPERGLFLFPRLKGGEWAMSIRHAVWDVDPDATQPPEPSLLLRAQPLLDCVLGVGRWELLQWRTFADTYSASMTPVVERVAGGAATVVSGTHGSGVRLAPALALQAARLASRALDESSRTTSRRASCLR